MNAATLAPIGNRKTVKVGGDASGGNLRSGTFTANLLNQYTGRNLPNVGNGFYDSPVDIFGTASSSSTVTVNQGATYRKGEYYHRVVPVDNSVQEHWLSITATAVIPQGGGDIVKTTTGNVYVPQTPESYTYDDDGNLLSDGRWNYTWDTENRLVEMLVKTNITQGPRLKVAFTYDWMGRRITSQVEQHSPGTWTTIEKYHFAYDGWNVLLRKAHLTTLVNDQAYVWGLDLSGSLQGAGGVGGLLWVNDYSKHNAVVTDGNGNVMSLWDSGSQTNTATYEYGPFGESLRQTGSLAKGNPFRFSSKYQDTHSEHYYYGYRSYNPVTARWLSRDPVGERGGLNTYGFVNNCPSQKIDRLGLNDVMYFAQERLWENARPSLVALFPQDPAAPAIGNQLQGYPSGVNFNSWFEREQSHMLSDRVSAAENSINSALKAACAVGRNAGDLYSLFDSTIAEDIVPSVPQFEVVPINKDQLRYKNYPPSPTEHPEDHLQSYWDANRRLGRHVYRVTDPNVNQTLCTRDRCFVWSAFLEVYDSPGVTSLTDSWQGSTLTALGALTDSPPVVIARWKIKGRVCCPKSE